MLFQFHEMATNLPLYDSSTDEDFIEMELSSSSSPQSRDFEFQTSSLTTNERETPTFPADELFYKGKLLPLHLPPRRRMVDNLLHTAAATFEITKRPFEKDSMPPLILFPTCSTAPCTNTLNTPFDSCNISPSESCRVSCEINPDDYFFEWSSELSSFIHHSNHNHNHNHHPITKKPWSKKQKLIKHYSVLGQKLKASRAYLKSLFTKSVCSDESSSKATCNIAEAGNFSKAEESSNKYVKIAKKMPTIAAIIKNIDKEGVDDNSSSSNNLVVQRRSFSGAIKRHSPTKCLSSSSSNSSSNSSSFSINSNNGGFHHELQFLRRNSSATEIEGSIEAAIAHCKNSQQMIFSDEEDDQKKSKYAKINE